MMCRLDLYLKGVFVKSYDVFLSEPIDELSFDDNCKIREIQLRAAVEQMKIQHVRSVIKSEYNYLILATIQSEKFKDYEPE